MTKIYNGEGLILGRVASVIAKEALLGEEIVVVNCEKMVISGRKINTVAREKWKWDRRGYPLKSPKYSRRPDKFVRLTIRRMLPWKIARGKEVFHNIKCFIGVPAGMEGQNMIQPKGAQAKKLPTLNCMTVGEVCQSLSGKDYGKND